MCSRLKEKGRRGDKLQSDRPPRWCGGIRCTCSAHNVNQRDRSGMAMAASTWLGPRGSSLSLLILLLAAVAQPWSACCLLSARPPLAPLAPLAPLSPLALKVKVWPTSRHARDTRGGVSSARRGRRAVAAWLYMQHPQAAGRHVRQAQAKLGATVASFILLVDLWATPSFVHSLTES